MANSSSGVGSNANPNLNLNLGLNLNLIASTSLASAEPPPPLGPLASALQAASATTMGTGASSAQASGAAGAGGLSQRSRQLVCADCEKALPDQIVFDKIELIIRRMQDEQNGLPVKTAKSFMSKIPSVFTGTDLIQWMMKNLQLDDQQEAIHLANLIASHGYIFPIEDHTLSIKNDCTFYRFQTPYLWPSNNTEPENTDYAVYLCKRTMQGKTRLELADYEAENLARLQKMFSRKWEFIFMQAEAQAKVDKKRDKLERKVLDSQERAFWDVYRPVPGCVNTTELDIKKACRLSKLAKRCSDCQRNFLSGASGSSSSVAQSQRSQSQSQRQQHQQQQQQHQPQHEPQVAPARASTSQAEQIALDESETTQRAEDELELEADEEPIMEPTDETGEERRRAAAVEPSSPHPSPVEVGSPDLGSPVHSAAPDTGGDESRGSAQVESSERAPDADAGGLVEVARGGSTVDGSPSPSQQVHEREKDEKLAEVKTADGDGDGDQVSASSKGAHKHHAAHHHHSHHHTHHHHSGQHSHHHRTHQHQHQQQQQQQQHQHQHHHHPHQHPHHHHSHHHHHHHHRQCPHHAARAQQQRNENVSPLADADKSGAGAPPVQLAKMGDATDQGESSRHRKHAPHCSRRRLAGSFDQSSVAQKTIAAAPAPSVGAPLSAQTPDKGGAARRKSECAARAMSMTVSEPTAAAPPERVHSHAPSVSDLPTAAEEAAAAAVSVAAATATVAAAAATTPSAARAESRDSGAHHLSATQGVAAGNEPSERPASACSSLASLARETGARPMSAAAALTTPTPTTTTTDRQKGARKISLRINRSPSEQITSTSSATSSVGALSGATVIDAAPDRLKHSGHAQLKGAQSVSASPAATTTTGGAAASGRARGCVVAANSVGGGVGVSVSGGGGATGGQTGALGANENAAFIGDLERELESLRVRLERRIGGVKMSKVTQSYLSYFKQWADYDPFIAQPIPSNPWCSDSTELWDSERQTKDVHCRRVRRWAFSLKELLNDPAGREQFYRFLEKEFSAENLKFWDAIQELKRVHARDVARRVEAIWTEYLAQDANCPINIDSKSYETSKRNMAKNKNNRYIFDEAAGHVYQLMKNDSYPRYLRSDMYKDYKEASERKRPNQVAFDVFKPQISNLKHKFNF